MAPIIEEYSSLIILLIVVVFTTITGIFYNRMDKYEPEPITRIFFAFFLGLISLIPAFFGELLVVILFAVDSQFTLAVVIAPIIEEGSKAMFVLYLAKNENFDGPLDGLIYGAMVGAGFAAGENFLYGFRFTEVGGAGFGISLTLIRSVTQIIGHPLYTGLIGAGIGEVKVGLHNNIYSGVWRGVLLHAMWNSTSNLIGYGYYFGILIVVITSIILLFNEIKIAVKLDEHAFNSGYYDKKHSAKQSNSEGFYRPEFRSEDYQ